MNDCTNFQTLKFELDNLIAEVENDQNLSITIGFFAKLCNNFI